MYTLTRYDYGDAMSKSRDANIRANHWGESWELLMLISCDVSHTLS